MALEFWMVTAVRKDGSTQVKQHVAREVAQAIATTALTTPECLEVLEGVHVERCEPHVEYCSQGPLLPLDDALRFRQPADALTQLLR